MFKGSREERKIRSFITSSYLSSDDALLRSNKIFLCAIYLPHLGISFFVHIERLAGNLEVFKGSREERELRIYISPLLPP